ncbi:hypothetical protein KKF91_21620, partial [Myxococcota bacterium]|nr:hypothetical protein [Myxococcota bacterium]
ASEQAAFVAEVRALPLMPVDVREDRTCHREAVGDRAAFYPPQFLRGEVPLPGLCFLSQAVCWGKLSRQERQETLKAEMVAWQGLFGLQDFKFPEVMRASVLPSMAWDQAPQRARFHDIAQLAAVCQLSGKTGQGERLPFERLGNQRALFALARLEVPCRAPNGGVWWVAAYRAYFGEDWIGDQSVEVLLRACKEAGQPSPDVPFILGPTAFSGYLARYASLDDQAQATDEETLDVDEVGLDEDEDAALPADERERWRTFFSWLGVNAHLRAVHFQDVEDHNTGWLRTEGFIKPRGWIFQALPDAVWDAWRATLIDSLDAKAIKDLHERRRWLYGIHHLEHLDVLLAAAAADAQGGVGRALYQHLQAHWPSLQPVARAVVALTKGHSPGRRKPPRAYTNETVSLCDNLWLWRLKEAAFCPTKHGPRRASQAWRPSRELDRRFKQTGPLLPVLEIDDPSGFAARLGVRAELTPSTFTLDDAEVWLRQLEIVSQNAPDVRAARRLLSTGCRHLMELLVGHQPEVKRAEARLPTLFGEMLVWRPAHQVFFAEQRGAGEGFDVPIFILEGDAHAKKPLQACFGVRLLEAALERSPTPEAPALLGAELDLFRKAIEACGPALLARLGVERQEERQASLDAHRLAAFLQGVEPVKALMLTTKLDGQLIGAANVPVGVYVDRDHPSHAFVRWSSQAWPPVEEDAERLAEALAVLFGAPRYESFLTLIKARDEAARLRILRRAGASADLEEYQRRLHGDDDLWVEPAPAPKTAGPAPLTSPSPQASPAQALAPTPADTPEAPCHPLWPAASLSVLGCPVRIMSPSAQHTVEGAASVQMREGGTHGYATHRTDLTALDQLGMSVAMSFEQARLARAGGGRVFDVSHPDHIKAASGALRGVFERELRGVSEAWPGFDLLSLDASGRLDRAVELKSSGIAARRQACTWNEWKSAGDPSLRGRYYLYLVGNLRSDLSEQAPFIRTVRDPFGQLHADVQVNTRVERKVYLRVADLQEAEEERLQIIPDAQRSASSAQRP